MTDPMTSHSATPPAGADPHRPEIRTISVSGATEGDSTRDRCAALGIAWLKEAPEADAEAVALIEETA